MSSLELKSNATIAAATSREKACAFSAPTCIHWLRPLRRRPAAHMRRYASRAALQRHGVKSRQLHVDLSYSTFGGVAADEQTSQGQRPARPNAWVLVVIFLYPSPILMYQ